MTTRAMIVLIGMLYTSAAYAQQFHHAYTITLPDSLVKVQPARVDINNDGLLDLLLLSEAASGRTYLQIVKGDTTMTPFLHWQSTRTIGPLKAFALLDYDHDNRIDVIISSLAGRVAVYTNRGNFTFTETHLNMPPFSQSLMADLNADGIAEWVISDPLSTENKLKVYRQSGAFSWTLLHDSLRISAISLGLTDQNFDGRPDLFVSGNASADSVVTAVLINDGATGFGPHVKFNFAGRSSAADVNADGIFDFISMGNDNHNVAATRMFRSGSGTHDAIDIPVVMTGGTPFTADMNSDGVVDYNYRGRRGSDTLNIIQYALNDFDTIASAGYRAHVFGDEDRDGDLDLVIVKKSARLELHGYKNMTHVNAPPAMPKNAVSIAVFDRVFYYWDPSTDDHTPQVSITYDLYLDGTNAYAAEFDLLNEKRLTATHGNNGTQNFKLLDDVRGRQFAVQAVDNSFHASKPCIGVRSGCTSLALTEVLLCEDEVAKLKAPREVLWFSFLKGYLGKHQVVDWQNDSDTVFYYDPFVKGCDGAKVFTVRVTNDAVRRTQTRYGCAGQSLSLSVDAGWNSVSWRSHRRGSLGSGQTINYVITDLATETDTVTATMTSGAGCTRRDRFVVKVSAPVVTVVPEQVRIAGGSSVQLKAGGAIRYEWRPPSGLTATDVPDPVASPSVSTTYTVVGYDSLQCHGEARSVVSVESGGFIPNLFTPNDDGKNDEVRVYGLTDARNFLFTIHNREGSLVYQTRSIAEATQKGWDGTKQGTRQPAGVYFWKVKGELTSGERLLLNGKDSGSIVLVR